MAATARSMESLNALVATYGDAVLPLELDVTDKAAVFENVKRAAEYFGRLDVVVNNAGYAQIGAIEELTEAELPAGLRGPARDLGAVAGPVGGGPRRRRRNGGPRRRNCRYPPVEWKTGGAPRAPPVA